MLTKRSIGLLAAAALVFACSDEPAPQEIPDDPVPDASPPDAAELTAPTISVAFEPATITAGETAAFTATFTDFTLVDPRTGPPVRPNEGHFHVFINENPNYTALWEDSTTFESTPQDPPGSYSFRAVLVGSDHVEISPTVEATATLQINAP